MLRAHERGMDWLGLTNVAIPAGLSLDETAAALAKPVQLGYSSSAASAALSTSSQARASGSPPHARDPQSLTSRRRRHERRRHSGPRRLLHVLPAQPGGLAVPVLSRDRGAGEQPGPENMTLLEYRIVAS
jgi:hypothetical protein